jgi:phosphate transport system permease protein
MSTETQTPPRSIGQLPSGAAVNQNVALRQNVGRVWQAIFFVCTFIGLVVLLLLLYNVANDAFGGVATQSSTPVAEVFGERAPEQLSKAELIAILEDRLRSRVLGNLNREQPLAERSESALIEIINSEIIKPEIVAVYQLSEWLFNRAAIEAEVKEDFPEATLSFKSWLNAPFLTTPMSSDPTLAGIRSAALGTLWLLGLTMLIAFPLGIGAALYLEEYTDAKPFDERQGWGRWLNALLNRLSGLIAVNIYNLSGVPSIIYGMLGLAIFVRALEGLTSGAIFGMSSGGEGTSNGRTIIAAALTMALLVLPVVIISSQEAIRAVSNALRQASYGLGATKWQTIWNVVLPNALPGILTGTILAISRAIGETAPLIVVGASTFIVSDPSSPFSKFTVLPIQIYNWTSRPQEEFRAIAAAAIIVLLVLLLSMNAVAITLRNYLRSQKVS